MSKRYRTNQNYTSVSNLPYQIQFPALESSILLETGGDTGISIRNFSSTLSGNISGGTLRFQYDSSFWNKDFYTTHYNNFCAGIFLNVYRNGQYSSCIFPLVLPRLCLASSDQGILSSFDFRLQQESVCYALNLLFSKPGFIITNLLGTYQYTALGLNDALFPILQTAQLPPLLWSLLPNSGQMVLRQNPAYVDAYPDFILSFQLMTLTSTFQASQTINTGTVIQVDGLSGWFGQGGYLFGFGEWNPANYRFSDYYSLHPTEYQYIQTLALGTSVPDDGQFFTRVQLSGTQTIIISKRISALTESRYTIINSSSLSRLQRRSIVTNQQNNLLSKAVGVLFNIPDDNNVYEDITGPKAIESIAPMIYNYSQFNGNNTIDIQFVDEWNNTLVPYDMNQSNANANRAYYEDVDMAPIFPPVIYHSLDPYFATNAPYHDCLFPYYKINQKAIVYPKVSPSGNTLDNTTLACIPPSTNITHFLRTLGT